MKTNHIVIKGGPGTHQLSVSVDGVDVSDSCLFVSFQADAQIADLIVVTLKLVATVEVSADVGKIQPPAPGWRPIL